MENDQREGFYKDRYFEGLANDIKEIKDNARKQSEDIADIKSKVIYMYGFAAAIGLVASLVIDWLRTNIFNIPH